MSKITNDWSGTGCCIAAPIWQQWASKGYDSIESTNIITTHGKDGQGTASSLDAALQSLSPYSIMITINNNNNNNNNNNSRLCQLRIVITAALVLFACNHILARRLCAGGHLDLM